MSTLSARVRAALSRFATWRFGQVVIYHGPIGAARYMVVAELNEVGGSRVVYLDCKCRVACDHAQTTGLALTYLWKQGLLRIEPGSTATGTATEGD